MGSPLDNPGIKTNQPNNQRYIMKMLKLEKTYLNLDHVTRVEDLSNGNLCKIRVWLLASLESVFFSCADAETIKRCFEQNNGNHLDKDEAVHDYDAPSMQEIKLASKDAAEYGHSLESVKPIPDEGDSVWVEKGVSEVTRRTSTDSKDPEEVVILLYCTRPTPVKGFRTRGRIARILVYLVCEFWDSSA